MVEDFDPICVAHVFFDVAGDNDAAFGDGTDDVEPRVGDGAGGGVVGFPWTACGRAGDEGVEGCDGGVFAVMGFGPGVVGFFPEVGDEDVCSSRFVGEVGVQESFGGSRSALSGRREGGVSYISLKTLFHPSILI